MECSLHSPECPLDEEVTVLEAIYINELEVNRAEHGHVTELRLVLHPATADETDRQYVKITLVIKPPDTYPEQVPDIRIENSRGLSDSQILCLTKALHLHAESQRGWPMLHELIETAKDTLTDGNVPHCPCAICLEHFTSDDDIHKTECYHYYHTECLWEYVDYYRNNLEDKSKGKLVPCPICREDMELDFPVGVKKKVEVGEASGYVPDAYVRALQTKMQEIYERQKEKGGIIDLEAEKNKFLVQNGTVLLGRQFTDESEERMNEVLDREREKEQSVPVVENPRMQRRKDYENGRDNRNWRRGRHPRGYEGRAADDRRCDNRGSDARSKNGSDARPRNRVSDARSRKSGDVNNERNQHNEGGRAARWGRRGRQGGAEFHRGDHAQSAGTSRAEGQSAGSSRQEGQDAGTSRQEGQGAGTSRQEGQGAGTSRQEGQGAGTSRQGGQSAGTSRHEQTGAQIVENKDNQNGVAPVIKERRSQRHRGDSWNYQGRGGGHSEGRSDGRGDQSAGSERRGRGRQSPMNPPASPDRDPRKIEGGRRNQRRRGGPDHGAPDRTGPYSGPECAGSHGLESAHISEHSHEHGPKIAVLEANTNGFDHARNGLNPDAVPTERRNQDTRNIRFNSGRGRRGQNRNFDSPKSVNTPDIVADVPHESGSRVNPTEYTTMNTSYDRVERPQWDRNGAFPRPYSSRGRGRGFRDENSCVGAIGRGHFKPRGAHGPGRDRQHQIQQPQSS